MEHESRPVGPGSSSPEENLWRNADFLKLWSAQTVSVTGSLLGALQFTAILTLDASPVQMSVLTAAGVVPALLFGFVVGAWVDRLKRRPILIAADLIRMALLGSIPVAWAIDMLHIEQLYIVAFFHGFMTGIEREVKRQGKERVWHCMMKLAPKLPVWVRRRLFGSVHRQLGGQLRFIISGGAALDPALGAKWESLGVQVLQGYGATEASPVISSHTLESARHDSAGRSLPRVEVRIADDGEIQVRGPNVTAGYWEDPEQTAAVFDGDWYRTGDQGFLSADGFLHIRGRTRDMIVLPNGLNVFPDDIETVLKRHEDVTDACVIGLARESRTEVHAVYTGIDQQQASQVTKWANSQLGDHQRIRGFSVWPDVEFPRTHTMKIKKNEVADALMAQSNGAMATS